MEAYRIENLTFTYPEADSPALSDVSFSVDRGEFITICGTSGCGKTTLLRLLKGSLAPNGELTGSILFAGEPIESLADRKQAADIGFVAQNPDNQIVTDTVWHELAFGAESLGMSNAEIRLRVSEMASFFGIQTWFYNKTSELAGGQKQMLNLASVMVMQPSVLILDEPTSHLDPIAAQEFLNTLERINRELGVTVILSEHRLEDTVPLSDRVIVLEDGKITADDTPRNIGAALKNSGIYHALPTPIRVYEAVRNDLECPLTVGEGRRWLEQTAQNSPLKADMIPIDTDMPQTGDLAVKLKDVWFRYDKNLPDVAKGLTFNVRKGELFAILGGNGTGKTTALSIISGLLKPYRGDISLSGSVGLLPQNPQLLFAKKTVFEDIAEALPQKQLSETERSDKVKRAAKLCRIDNLLDRHPYDLSGGQQQRAAFAKVLIRNPEILLLDEPTKGTDAEFKQVFAEILKSLKKDGTTIIMVSHDIEFCAEYADRCAMFFDGSITSEGTPREFFAGNSFYTTAANRMARTLLPNAVLTEDIILACGGEPEKKTPKKRCDIAAADKADTVKKEMPSQKRHGIEKRILMTLLFIILAVPATILFGVFALDDRKYYFISLLIILETLIPFAVSFESRKPQLHELVVISVLCGIAVAGNAAFYMLPQFKPAAAIIIIAGVCFGGETGFLVGAITALVSNFFAGQGPWTPWQMFAFGMVGLAAGVFCGRKLTKRLKIMLCIFGGLAVFVIYGGIMNPASVIMAQERPSLGMFVSAYAMGIPFDFVHAGATIIFLWLFASLMIEKIERLKRKYGIGV